VTNLPPAATYRKLALEVRLAARAKTDRYAQRALNRQADRYDQVADQIDRADPPRRAPSPEPV
jgi:hypothetical protein